MNNRHETPEKEREQLRQEELKKNRIGALKDGINRGEHTNLADMVGGLGWKGTGVLIIILVIGYILFKLIF
ncbi:DUF6366 family protein [Cytobacillus sp.]|uniref:DUF6366 family protein n=1 Tax=Cytobacillus sp. TaxID=2675269 RepID=UPI0028BDB900|nr:DUF6366 family protein [Cytobacillus sp.]